MLIQVQEIAESYGGVSFLPQSFFLSVFIGEATRTSLRASAIKGMIQTQTRRSFRARSKVHSKSKKVRSPASITSSISSMRSSSSTLNRLRRRRVGPLVDRSLDKVPESLELKSVSSAKIQATEAEPYDLGDSLLGPQDVAILLQAGLTSVMKSSTVVQLNQRMLLDLIESQPRNFAIAVLAEIGTSPRSLTSALMALLELDQTAFKPEHQIDVHELIESWFSDIKVPRREDHMAGGRWARQSYYDGVFSVATHIWEDAQQYKAMKSRVQRVRHSQECDPLPEPRSSQTTDDQERSNICPKLEAAMQEAVACISRADEAGKSILENLLDGSANADDRAAVVSLYEKAFDACAAVLAFDKHALITPCFSDFYRRNYDALMVKSLFDNVLEDVDQVRHWYVMRTRVGSVNG